VSRHLGAPNDAPTEDGLVGLLADLGKMGIGPDHVDLDALLDMPSAAAVSEHLKGVADDMLDGREKELGPEAWSQVERWVLLRTIDALWVDHLTELDDMRRGIGLRGYAQQDPLNEFRKEAFRLYEELSGFIRHQVANAIFRVQLQRVPDPNAPRPLPGPGQQARGAVPAAVGAAGPGVTGTAGSAILSAGRATAGGRDGRGRAAGPVAGAGAGAAAAAGAQARPGYTPGGAKIGRNDACWCGSGLKYKKCHGR
jgi:preprotein translocase subunit SecA